MFDKLFLGVEIEDNDHYGTMLLTLVIDLLNSIKSGHSNESVKAKARNIIQVSCEPMFDLMICELEWRPDETDYAVLILEQCINMATDDFLAIAKRRTNSKRRRERPTKLQLDDMKVGVMMAYLMNVSVGVRMQIEDTFIADHGDLCFRRNT